MGPEQLFLGLELPTSPVGPREAGLGERGPPAYIPDQAQTGRGLTCKGMGWHGWTGRAQSGRGGADRRVPHPAHQSPVSSPLPWQLGPG